MTEPALMERMSASWGWDPLAMTNGLTSGVSAALWVGGGETPIEVGLSDGPLGEAHILSLQFEPFAADLFLDDKLRFSKPLGVGSVNLIQSEERPRAVMKGPFHCLHIYLPQQTIDTVCEAGSVAPESVELLDPMGARDEAILRVGRDLVAEMRAREPFSRLRTDLLGQDLAVHMLRAHSNRMRHSLAPARGGLAPWQAARVKEYLEAHLAKDVGLAELAALVDLSPKHFARAFKQTTGLPPHRYLIARRIERAMQLLADPTPLAEIALACGFADQSHFTAAFRKAIGATPGHWRREIAR